MRRSAVRLVAQVRGGAFIGTRSLSALDVNSGCAQSSCLQSAGNPSGGILADELARSEQNSDATHEREDKDVWPEVGEGGAAEDDAAQKSLCSSWRG
jgi:hypothetical protein